MMKKIPPPIYLALAICALVGLAVACGGGGSSAAGTSSNAASPSPSASATAIPITSPSASPSTSATPIASTPTVTWNLLVAGDIAQCGATAAAQTAAERTAQLVNRQIAAAGTATQILTLGDNVYNVGLASEYQSCYAPTWGRYLSQTYATPGNHDYGTGNADAYFDYFGASAGPTRSGYYRIDRNGWTIFSLNSNIDTSASSPQVAWLKTQLLTAAPCVAAAWHHPVFTSAPRGDNAKMADVWSVLDQAKADVVFSGHEHQYERFAALTSDGRQQVAQGLPAFVVGTGGASLTGFPGMHLASQKQISQFGVLHLALQPGQMRWQFTNVDDQMLDDGRLDCRAK
jgi:acid phosphatase type 7